MPPGDKKIITTQSKRAEDLSGQIFDDWLVESFSHRIRNESAGNYNTYYNCVCVACGKQKQVPASNLKRKSARRKGCGCSVRRGKDYTGEKFGEWTALEPVKVIRYAGNYHKNMWKCLHDDGTIQCLDINALKRKTKRQQQ